MCWIETFILLLLQKHMLQQLQSMHDFGVVWAFVITKSCAMKTLLVLTTVVMKTRDLKRVKLQVMKQNIVDCFGR